LRFSLENNWSRKLFTALARKHGLEPYRYYRQRYTTVMLKVTQRYCDEVLWPEFLKLDEILIKYLNEITDRVVREAIHNDASEVTIRQQLLESE
jgi:tRNA nucleotidyltransferase (CCA-adding enzyme)